MSRVKKDPNAETSERDAINPPFHTKEAFSAFYGIDYREAKEVLHFCFGVEPTIGVKGLDEELWRIKNSEFKRAVCRYRQAKKNQHLKGKF